MQARLLFKSAHMWTNISNHLTWYAKNAELELGGPRGGGSRRGIRPGGGPVDGVGFGLGIYPGY